MVELVGLPGSGKSTLATGLATALKENSFPAMGLRDAAMRAISAQRPKIGFIKGRLERQSLYGAVLFSKAHPELFHWLHMKSLSDLNLLLWNTEVMSQIGIVENFGKPDMVVINDEGFIQRAASTMLEKGCVPDITDGSALFPDDSLTIFLELDAAISVERTLNRGRTFHGVLKGDTEAGTVANFEAYQNILRTGVEAHQKRGCQVLTVDAERDADALSQDVIDWLRPHLPAPKPPRPIPAKRLARIQKKLAARRSAKA